MWKTQQQHFIGMQLCKIYLLLTVVIEFLNKYSCSYYFRSFWNSWDPPWSIQKQISKVGYFDLIECLHNIFPIQFTTWIIDKVNKMSLIFLCCCWIMDISIYVWFIYKTIYPLLQKDWFHRLKTYCYFCQIRKT